MAVTISKLSTVVWGNEMVARATILLDSSYPTGGYALAPTKFNLSASLIFGVFVVGVNAAGSGIVQLVWDYAGQKLMAFTTSTAAHTHPLLLKNAAVADGATTRVNAGTNLLGANTGSDITVAGGGANGGVQASTAAASDLAQVANGVSLSAVTARIIVMADNHMAG
jgi:hypothetical protein